jgi:hypothetical protein
MQASVASVFSIPAQKGTPMRPHLTVRSFRVSGPILAVALLSSLGMAYAADPVDDLARFLQTRPYIQDKEQITAYQKNLAQCVKAIQHPSELRRAVLLTLFSPGFAVQPPNQPDEENPFGKIHQEVQSDLVKRLQNVLRERLRSKDTIRRLAVIAFLVDMARDESERGFPQGVEQDASHRFTWSMRGDLLKLLSNKDEEPRLRAAAAEAVAVLDPAGEKNLDALQALLKPEREVVERRAAAKALRRMLQHSSASPEPRPNLAPRIVAIAGLGLTDTKDAAVRLLCLKAIHEALLVNFPDAHERRPRVLAISVNEQMPAVIHLLAEDDLDVRLAAYQVLESTAMARREQQGGPFPPAAGAPEELPSSPPSRTGKNADAPPPLPSLRRTKIAQAPPPPPRNEENILPDPKLPLLDNILEAVPALAQGLRDKEVRVRLAALYVLESLGRQSAPAVEAVTQTLTKDKNGFVRWGAARVLHNMAPLEAKKAVPALAEALTDANKTVRLTAAQALGRFRSQAKDAVKALIVAVGDVEPNVRMAALNSLKEIGVAAHSATGAVVQALGDQKPEVRASAAKALAHLGPLDDKASKALANALEDVDATVRQAASETLLDKDPLSDNNGKD